MGKTQLRTLVARLCVIWPCLCWAGPQAQAQAQPVLGDLLNPAGGPTQRSAPIGGATGEAVPGSDTTSLFGRPNLLGDPGGVRGLLGRQGITLGLTETDELLANPTGGLVRGVAYEGVTQMQLGADLGTLIGLSGGTINVSALQIHGRSISFTQIGNLNAVSSFEATRATRLFELWYEQALGRGQVTVRVGQLAADQEFQLSRYAGTFINASFGWPTLSGVDLPSGGPAFPLGTPGVRVRVALRAVPGATLLAGVYNGNPAGPGLDDPQARDPSGTAFRVGDGVFAIGEVQYATGRKGAGQLPATYKVGGWYSSKSINDQRFGDADGSGAGRGANYAVYAIVDRLLWRPAQAPSGGLGGFARVTAAPGDRNLVGVFFDAGLTVRAPFSGRANDTAGLGVGQARTSARGAVQAGLAGVHGGETVLELTYQAQVAAAIQVQPDFQYVFAPGGHAPDPARRGRTIRDAAILGLRTAVNF